MEKIYRIISFPRFVDLIYKREEGFTCPTQWDDTYEGAFFTAQKNPERCEELFRELCKRYSDDYNKALENLIKCIYFPLFSYAQCWSKEADSDALWRIYSYDKMSVQICTTKECWQNILDKHLNPSSDNSNIVAIEDVKYDLIGDSAAIIKMLQEKVLKNNNLCDMYFHKRPAFRHEQEIRALIFLKNDAKFFEYANLCPIIDEILKKCDGKPGEMTINTIVSVVNSHLSNEDMKTTIKRYWNIDLKGIDLSDYIKSVKLNPFAPDFMDDLLKDLCQRNNLNYVGKSELYCKI